MEHLTPIQITNELDRYIIGQKEAKKMVAIALRNRYRRSKLSPIDREEIMPKNIIMKGPTGVGKTEIAKRLAKLVKAPFIKVEATKYTEVGYVGRDVESMIRDLVEMSVRLVKEERFNDVQPKAENIVLNKLAEILYNDVKNNFSDKPKNLVLEELTQDIKAGKLDNTLVGVDIEEQQKPLEIIPGSGQEINLGSIFGGPFNNKKKKHRVIKLKEAYDILMQEESMKLIDMDNVNSEAIRRAENDGIIFIDEIDKIAAKGSANGPDVSREGVQRDILPIVDGCTVMTKYGQIKTDYILFIAAGAFHVSKVEDLIPELQGRFPIIVELENLTKEDFKKILTEPDNAITGQYKKLLSVDGVDITFTDDALEEIALIAENENISSENIGARRLHKIMEYLLEDISFNACGALEPESIKIDKKFVDEKLHVKEETDKLKKYII